MFVPGSRQPDLAPRAMPTPPLALETWAWDLAEPHCWDSLIQLSRFHPLPALKSASTRIESSFIGRARVT
jgi:hypothetical protein